MGRPKLAKKPCTAAGCSNFIWARGYCGKHLQRFKKYGDAEVGSWDWAWKERFQKAQRPQPNGCITLESSDRNSTGHSRFYVRAQRIGSHRLAWQIAHGPIPEGLWVLHKCNNGACVNVEHLYVGTPKQNGQDMVAAGHSQRGEKNRKAKWTKEDIQTIRFLAENKIRRKTILEFYPMDSSSYHDIVNRKTWRHV